MAQDAERGAGAAATHGVELRLALASGGVGGDLGLGELGELGGLGGLGDWGDLGLGDLGLRGWGRICFSRV